jgi:hypothetical protein
MDIDYIYKIEVTVDCLFFIFGPGVFGIIGFPRLLLALYIAKLVIEDEDNAELGVDEGRGHAV